MASAPKVCRLCHHLNHPEKFCLLLKRVGPQQRRVLVERAGLCLNCLSRHHLVDECNSRHSCEYCGARHNTRLCTDCTNEQAPIAAEATRLYQLLQVKAEHGPYSGLFNFFLNEKAVSSVMHHHSVQKLLPESERYTKVGSLVLTLSPPSVPQKRFGVVLEVDSNFNHPIQHQLPAPFADFVSNIVPLANPWPHEPQQVDGILGAAFIRGIAREEPAPVTIGDFRARPTAFGWLGSGIWSPNDRQYAITPYSIQDLMD